MNAKRGQENQKLRAPQGPGRAHQIRIVGGRLKRSRITVLDKPGLRPTPDRVRETLFNWLGQDLSGWACIDVFAGTGALGLEAASRGAQAVTLVDLDPDICRHLNKTTRQLGLEQVQVCRGDGLAHLAGLQAHGQDLVFLDPPFGSGLFEASLGQAWRVVKPDGWVYLEAPLAWQEAALAMHGFELYRYLKAGQVHAHLLRAYRSSQEGAKE